jgi:hypothetical protein
MTWLQTYTGKAFHILEPSLDDICIEDIAHALSMQTRYNGHCLNFYSVAEHCCYISDRCSKPNKLWGLLHDASEAYVCDIPRPLKPHLTDYKLIETRIMYVIADKFNLLGVMPSEVKALDNRILVNERLQNMSTPPQEGANTGDVIEDLELQFWTPGLARYEFLKRFKRLYGG